MKTRKIVTTLTAIALLLTMNSATAQPLNTTLSKSIPDDALNVKYVGAEDDYLVFEVTISNTGNKHPILTISDQDVGQLYSETIKGNTETRKVKIEKRESQSLSFELISDKKEYFKTFSINTSFVAKTTIQEGEIVTRY